MQVSSYPKIYNLGRPEVEHIFDGVVFVQEKVDGSQFSFGLRNGEFWACSRRTDIPLHAPGMFAAAIESLYDLPLCEGWIYRGEYLAKPCHNTLAYDRVPKRHVILFDVMTLTGQYLGEASLKVEAKHLGLEVVPMLYVGCPTRAALEHLLKSEISILGGARIEGVVVKNYGLYGPDGKPLMAKLVSEEFKETHQKAWREANPVSSDIISRIVETYRTPARWQKAVQHLRECDVLVHGPQDIGPLIREVQSDVYQECRDEIASALFIWAWRQVSRRLTTGLPEWYKQQLLDKQFGQKTEDA